MSEQELYRQTKQALSTYARSLSQRQLAMTCVACPAWTLQDTLAHHIHAQRCLAEGTSPDTTLISLTEPDSKKRADATSRRDDWTARGVEDRRGRSLEELLDEWSQVSEAMGSGHTALADLTAHFDDIRETIEGPRPRTGPDIVHSLGRMHHLLSMRLDAAGVRPVGFRCSDIDLRLEGHAEGGVVAGVAYEMLRCVFSRRSRPDADQVLLWNSTTPVARNLFAVYGWPTS